VWEPEHASCALQVNLHAASKVDFAAAMDNAQKHAGLLYTLELTSGTRPRDRHALRSHAAAFTSSSYHSIHEAWCRGVLCVPKARAGFVAALHADAATFAGALHCAYCADQSIAEPRVCPLLLPENKDDKTIVDGMQLSKLFQAAILAQFVPKTALRQLQISVPLPRHASGLLSDALPVANSLTSLSFRGSLIGDDHMALIIPGLRNAPQITCLDVAGCRLTEPSALALADLVRSRVIRYDESCLLPTKRVSDGWMRQFGREREREGCERKGKEGHGIARSVQLLLAAYLQLSGAPALQTAVDNTCRAEQEWFQQSLRTYPDSSLVPELRFRLHQQRLQRVHEQLKTRCPPLRVLDISGNQVGVDTRADLILVDPGMHSASLQQQSVRLCAFALGVCVCGEGEEETWKESRMQEALLLCMQEAPDKSAL
jgi:hypothetical protein